MVNILAVIPEKLYASRLYIIVRETEEINNKVLYVSLNKTFKSLIDQFQPTKINLSKFLFLDTITASVIEPEPDNRCVFVKGAEDLNLLLKNIIDAVKKHDCDAIIFDSLSSLTTYSDQGPIISFITRLMGGLSLLYCSAVFTALKNDEESPIVHHTRLKVDKMYEIK